MPAQDLAVIVEPAARGQSQAQSSSQSISSIEGSNNGIELSPENAKTKSRLLRQEDLLLPQKACTYDGCGRTFKRTGNLNRHRKMHIELDSTRSVK
jgi:hypothetical protein